jgi:hypothetical protein
MVWKDKRDVGILTNIHDPPSKGNFCDEHGNAIKPVIVADCNCHIGCVDKGDRTANTCTASRRTWKWTKKHFFHLLDLGVLNSYILLLSCGRKKISGRDFQLAVFRDMLARGGYERRPLRPIGRPVLASTNRQAGHTPQ